MSKKRITWENLIYAAIGASITLGVTICAGEYSNYRNKANISGRVTTINIFKNPLGEWSLSAYYSLTNSGRSQTTISLQNLDVLFQGLFPNPYSFTIDKEIELAGLSVLQDSIELRIPNHFDTITQPPDLLSVGLRYRLPNRKKAFTTKQDSSNQSIGFMFVDYSKEPPPKELKNPNFVERGDSIEVIMRKVPIVYQGKTYIGLLYPRDAKIEYEVKENDIFVKCFHSRPLGEIITAGEYLFEPIIFNPPKEIADKIHQGNGLFLEVLVENKLENETVIIPYKVIMGQNPKQIVYFLR